MRPSEPLSTLFQSSPVLGSTRTVQSVLWRCEIQRTSGWGTEHGTAVIVMQRYRIHIPFPTLLFLVLTIASSLRYVKQCSGLLATNVALGERTGGRETTHGTVFAIVHRCQFKVAYSRLSLLYCFRFPYNYMLLSSNTGLIHYHVTQDRNTIHFDFINAIRDVQCAVTSR